MQHTHKTKTEYSAKQTNSRAHHLPTNADTHTWEYHQMKNTKHIRDYQIQEPTLHDPPHHQQLWVLYTNYQQHTHWQLLHFPSLICWHSKSWSHKTSRSSTAMQEIAIQHSLCSGSGNMRISSQQEPKTPTWYWYSIMSWIPRAQWRSGMRSLRWRMGYRQHGTIWSRSSRIGGSDRTWRYWRGQRDSYYYQLYWQKTTWGRS